MSDKKVIELQPGIWITKEDWDNCNKFEKEQEKKLIEFMYKTHKKYMEDKDAATETN